MSKPVVLISGVGRTVGIGAGVAEKLAAEGWDLALTYWTPYDARMPWGERPNDIAVLENELIALGARVLSIPGDLEQPDSASEIFKAANKAFGPISALVMAHCESVNSSILNTTIESFDRHFAVNARASWQLIRELALQVPGTGGRIVALTSDSTVDNLPYGASKGALDRIVLAASREGLYQSWGRHTTGSTLWETFPPEDRIGVGGSDGVSNLGRNAPRRPHAGTGAGI
jgi:3-oxoacyl-[acyl-carrier protein] reductase